MITDPISDLITRIKNASDARKDTVTVIASKFAESVAYMLKEAGYIAAVEKKQEKRELSLKLVYIEGEPRIHGVERLSKPSRRLYIKSRDIRSYRSGFGNYVFSTPKGVLTDVAAKKLKVGGEILFKIW